MYYHHKCAQEPSFGAIGQYLGAFGQSVAGKIVCFLLIEIVFSNK